MRKTSLVEGEYYHIFNRGVDKRTIFKDNDDFSRFLLSMVEFNSVEPIGSIFEHSFKQKPKLGHPVSKSNKKHKPLVEFVVFCLNKNHFHFILKQLVKDGITKFMHKLTMGFSKYFNERNERSGSLFQGRFKSVHVKSNEQLIHLSAYVNLNNIVHGYTNNNQFKSSWGEYLLNGKGICNKDIVIGQFKNIHDYRILAEETVREIRKRRYPESFAQMTLE